MSFDEMFAADMVGTVLDTDQGAVSITYTPDGEAGVTIPAFFVPAEDDLAGLEDGTMRTKRARAGISTEAANGIETPSDADTVTVDGTEWAIEDVHVDGVAAILDLVRYENVEKAGQDYRTRRP